MALYNGLAYVVFIGGIIWSVYSYGKQIDYNSTLEIILHMVLKCRQLVTVIMIIYFAVIFIFCFLILKKKHWSKQEADMRQKNNMTEEQMTQAWKCTRKFFMVFLIGGTLLVYLIFGAIAALIGAGNH